MFIVRGENIYPSAIEGTLRAIPGFGKEFQVIITRERAMDQLVVQAEYDEEVARKAASDPEALDRLRQEMEVRLRAVIGVRPVVKLVEPGTLPTTEFKARRVIDNRDLYCDVVSQAHP